MAKRDSWLSPEDLRRMFEPSDSQYRMMALCVVVILALSVVFKSSTPTWIWIAGLLVAVAIAIACACIYCSRLTKPRQKHDDTTTNNLK